MRSAVLVLLLLAGCSVEALARFRTRIAGVRVQAADFLRPGSDRSGRAFVVEQGGRMSDVRTALRRRFPRSSAEVGSGGEQGLLGLGFAPDTGLTGRFFVNYTNTAGDTVVARFRRAADPLLADPSRVLTCAGMGLAVRASSGSRFRSQRRPPRSGRTDICTLVLATADRATIRITAPRTRRSCWASFSDRRQRSRVAPDRLPGSCRQSIHRRTARVRSWSSAGVTRGATAFDPSRGGTGALVAGDVGQERGRGRLRAARTRRQELWMA